MNRDSTPISDFSKSVKGYRDRYQAINLHDNILVKVFEQDYAIFQRINPLKDRELYLDFSASIMAIIVELKHRAFIIEDEDLVQEYNKLYKKISDKVLDMES